MAQPEQAGRPTLVFGALGSYDRHRLQKMLNLAGGQEAGLRAVEVSESSAVYGNEAVVQRRDPAGRAVGWSQAGLVLRSARELVQPWEQFARDADASGIVIGPDGAATLHGSVSGAQPLYAHFIGSAVYFANCIHLLVEAAPDQLKADWQAWAEIIGMGAPLAGRTTFEGIRRLGPMEYVQTAPAEAPRGVRQAHWPWVDVEPGNHVAPRQLTDEVLDALRDQLLPFAGTDSGGAGLLHPMLSGGRDSRLLTGLALNLADDASRVTAWTTSSDTGTSLEELVAARVAGALGVQQHIVPGRNESFPQDFEAYARTVDFQASYHVWLMPVAQRLAKETGTVFDGLGGGVFLGGGFPDVEDAGNTGEASLLESRFARMAHYLDAANDVLAPRVGEVIRESAYGDFEPRAKDYVNHPNGATLSAYISRTLPGISLAPARVLGGHRPTAMPIVSHAVVTRALRVSHREKHDGAWYPDLLKAADAPLGALPTASDLTGRKRGHIRRIESIESTQFLQNLILNSPVRALLSPQVREAETAAWSALLGQTKPQHLLRGLAMLALWLETYQDRLDNPDCEVLLRG